MKILHALHCQDLKSLRGYHSLMHRGGVCAENVWKLVAKLSFLFTSSLPLVYWGNLIQQGYNNQSVVWTVIRAARWILNSTVGLNSQVTSGGKESHRKTNKTLKTVFSPIFIIVLTDSLHCSEQPLTSWVSEYCNAMFLCQVPLQNLTSQKFPGTPGGLDCGDRSLYPRGLWLLSTWC